MRAALLWLSKRSVAKRSSHLNLLRSLATSQSRSHHLFISVREGHDIVLPLGPQYRSQLPLSRQARSQCDANGKSMVIKRTPTGRSAPCIPIRQMSTGGISRKDFLWGISGSKKRLRDAETREKLSRQDETVGEPSFLAQLEAEGYSNVQEALQRVIIGAYQLLQEDKVDQAESMVAEAVRAAETLLDHNDQALAQVRDQQALLLFLQGQLQEAEQLAALSLDSVQHSAGAQGREFAVALCQLRLGSIFLGNGKIAAAANLLKESMETLQRVGSEGEAPLSEALLYMTLCRLQQPTVSDVKAAEPLLVQAIHNLVSIEILGVHLVRAALREHRGLMGAAVAASDWDLAEAILQQEVKLQEIALPQSEEMALTLYQYATLQYTRGFLEHGVQLCSDSLELARRLHRKESSSHVALRVHRLGTLRLAQGDSKEAISLLSSSCRSLTNTAGEVNPLTGESRAALALARVDHFDKTHKDAGYFVRFGYPHERAAILEEASQGLTDMRKGFGHSHPLVITLHDLFQKLHVSEHVKQTLWKPR